MGELLSRLQMMKEGDYVRVEWWSFSHHGIVVVFGELVLNFVSFNRSTDDETGRRQWISKHCEAFWCWIAEHHTESLDDKKPARVWGHCPFPECKATTSCQLRYKADQVVLTWFRNKVHDNQELSGSHKKCTQKKLIQSLKLFPEDTAVRSCVTWSRFTAAAAT